MTAPEDELLRISALLRERALAAYRRDVEAEKSLSAERDRIDGLRQAALAADADIGARQILGMGSLWRGELLRRRGALQMGIAEARARQGYSGAAAREAFSRDEAARALLENVWATRMSRRLASEEKALEELAALRLWRQW